MNRLIKWLIATVGIVFILLGIIIIYAILPIIENPNLASVLSQLSSILIGIGLVQLVIEFVATKHLAEKVAKEISYKINLPLEKFYQYRNELPALSDELTNCTEIWGAWYTGGLVASTGEIKYFKGKKTRIIVTHPDYEDALKAIEKITNSNISELKNEIIEFTKKANENNIYVKWFKGSVGNSIIIGNPNSRRNKGWARIEFIVPFGDPIDRPSIEVSQLHGIEFFEKIKNWHLKMWDESEEPRI